MLFASDGRIRHLEFIKYLMVRAHRAVLANKAKISYLMRNTSVAGIVQICTATVLKRVSDKPQVVFLKCRQRNSNILSTNLIVKRSPTALLNNERSIVFFRLSGKACHLLIRSLSIISGVIQMRQIDVINILEGLHILT